MSEEIKRQAIISSAVEQIKGLLETHYDAIRKAADESFVDDDTQTEPRTKVSIVVEWSALSEASTVSVKIGYSIRYKDESEAVVDPLQTKLPIDGGAE